MIGPAPTPSGVRPRGRTHVRIGGLVLALCMIAACHRPPSTRTPEDAVLAWRSAIERNDAELAWSLLSPGLQAELGHDAFVAEFNAASASLRADLATATRAGPDDVAGGKRGMKSKGKRRGKSGADPHVLRTATTVHEGGQWLSWIEVDGVYRVASGLPGLPDLSTPDRAIRAFVAAARAQDRSAMDQVLADELVELNQEQLAARLEAIEVALDSDALEQSEDGTRASLLYGSGRRLVLQQREGQWRVVGFK